MADIPRKKRGVKKETVEGEGRRRVGQQAKPVQFMVDLLSLCTLASAHTPRYFFCRWMLRSAHSASLSAEPSPFPSVVNNHIASEGGWERHWDTLERTHTQVENTQRHMDTGRCTRCIIQLTHGQAKSGWKPEEYSFSMCVCVWMYSRVCVCAWLNNIACQESPREIPFSFSFFHFVGPARDPAYPSLHQQRKPDIDHLSTGRHPPPPPRSTLHPKPHQRHGTRQAWEKGWR